MEDWGRTLVRLNGQDSAESNERERMSKANNNASGSPLQSVDQPQTDQDGPTNPARSAGDRLEAIDSDLKSIIRELDESANSKDEDAWKAYFAAEDVRSASARVRSAVRQLRYSER